MRLTREMVADMCFIAQRGAQLQAEATSNLPTSKARVLELHSEELIACKLRLEEYLTKTDIKE